MKTSISGPQLKRIVVLSSTASVGNPSEIAVLDEKDWNEENIIDIREKGRAANPVDMYRASKSLAEKGLSNLRSCWTSSLIEFTCIIILLFLNMQPHGNLYQHTSRR